MSKALILIDLQNDYFPGGGYPLHDAEGTLERILAAAQAARAAGIPIVHVQHVVPAEAGPAPFFNAGTSGVEIRPEALAAAPEAPVVIKTFADSFEQTALQETLARLGVRELVLAGMMTHNCVTHTAISKAAEAYERVTVLSDCCTTVDAILHQLALHALSTRIVLASASEALA